LDLALDVIDWNIDVTGSATVQTFHNRWGECLIRQIGKSFGSVFPAGTFKMPENQMGLFLAGHDLKYRMIYEPLALGSL
jgi:hypothetical protein